MIRRSKKLIILLLLTAGVVAVPFSSLYASSGTFSQPADICRDIGVLRGGINGVDEAYLSSMATRLQAMFITIRLIGKEPVASTYRWTVNFTDADLVDYDSGRNLLAYIKAHPELGWQGDQWGRIDPNGFLTPQAMYKVLLSVLGYNFGEDFDWDAAMTFASDIGMCAMVSKRGYLTNGDIAEMLVEALKTRRKNSDDTLCEYLVETGVVNDSAAGSVSMLPGSEGFKPLLSYRDGGPLLLETLLVADQKKISIKFNTALNPTYAKSLTNYNFYMPGTGYIPLPARCSSSMANENTVVLQFPSEGWLAYNNQIESDAFFMYIASDRKNELRVSGLYDVDGVRLREVFVDVVPEYGNSAGQSTGGFNSTNVLGARNPSQYLR